MYHCLNPKSYHPILHDMKTYPCDTKTLINQIHEVIEKKDFYWREVVNFLISFNQANDKKYFQMTSVGGERIYINIKTVMNMIDLMKELKINANALDRSDNDFYVYLASQINKDSFYVSLNEEGHFFLINQSAKNKEMDITKYLWHYSTAANLILNPKMIPSIIQNYPTKVKDYLNEKEDLLDLAISSNSDDLVSFYLKHIDLYAQKRLWSFTFINLYGKMTNIFNKVLKVEDPFAPITARRGMYCGKRTQSIMYTWLSFLEKQDKQLSPNYQQYIKNIYHVLQRVEKGEVSVTPSNYKRVLTFIDKLEKITKRHNVSAQIVKENGYKTNVLDGAKVYIETLMIQECVATPGADKKKNLKFKI